MKKQQIFFLSMMLFLCMVFAPPQKAQAQYVPVDSIVILKNTPHYCGDIAGSPYFCATPPVVGFFNAQVFPYNATIRDFSIESADESIVTVSAVIIQAWHKCDFYAHQVGETTITLRSLDPSVDIVTTVKVVVSELEQGQLKIVPATLDLMEGDWLNLSSVVDYDGYQYPYPNESLTWTSSQDQTAAVDEHGKIECRGIGETIITATAYNGVFATCKVTVIHRPPAQPQMPKIVKVGFRPHLTTSFNWLQNEVMPGTAIKIISNDAVTDAITYSLDGTDPTGLFGEHTTCPAKGSQLIYIYKNTTVRTVSLRTDPGFPHVYSTELNMDFIVKLEKPEVITKAKIDVYGSDNDPRYSCSIVYGTPIQLNYCNENVAGLTIRYTVDGSEPTESSLPGSGFDYKALKSSTTTIKAKAFAPNCKPSDTYTITFRVTSPPPVINPKDGEIYCYIPGTTIPAGLSIRFSLDGGPWTDYKGPISANFTGCKVLAAQTVSFFVSDIVCCWFCGDAPPPVVSLWNYRQNTFVPAYTKIGLLDPYPTKNFSVAEGDKFKLTTPGYPNAKIRFTTIDEPVTDTNGQNWPGNTDPNYTFQIYKSEVFHARSEIAGWHPSPDQRFAFGLAEKPKTPVFKNKANNVVYNEECGFEGVESVIFTRDGSTPSIQRMPDNLNGGININNYEIHGYRAFNKQFKIDLGGGNIHYYWKWVYIDDEGNLKDMKTSKTGLYKAISYKINELNDGVITSDVAMQFYNVMPRNEKFNIENGSIEKTLGYGKADEVCGLGGKFFRFLLKGIGVEVGSDTNYYAIGYGWKDPNMGDNAKDVAYKNLKAALNALDMNAATKDFEAYEYDAGKSSEGSGSSSLFNLNLKAIGLLSYRVTDKDEPSHIYGQMMAEAKTNAETEQSYPILPLFEARIKLKLNALCKAYLGLGLSSQLSREFIPKKIDATYGAKLNFQIGLNAGAAVGIPFFLYVGVDAKALFTLDWDIAAKTHEIWLQGKVFAIVKSCGIEKPLFKIYDCTGTCKKVLSKSSKNKSDDDTFDSDDFSEITDLFKPDLSTTSTNDWRPISRAYLKNRSAWLGETPLAKDGSMYNVLQTSIYSETEPKIAEGGGKRVMVFLADNEDRDDYNRSMLVYSVYNSGTDTWSTPVAVNDNGRADFFPCLTSNGSDIWLTWQNSNKLFTASTTIEEIVLAGKVCVSKFNSGTSTFATSSNIGDGFSPKIAVSSTGDACVAWTYNPTGDMYGTNSLTKIRESHSSSGTWSTPQDLKTGVGALINLDIAWFNGKYQVAYVIDTDNNFSTSDDHKMFVMDLTGTVLHAPVTNKTITATRFATIGNSKVLTWVENERLRYMTEAGATQNLTDSADMVTGNYKFFTNGSKTALVYPYKDHAVGFLYARHYEAGKFGTPFKLLTSGGFAGLYDGLIENNGNFYVVYNNSKIEIVGDDYVEENDLIDVRCPAPVNIRLLNTDFNHEDVKLGQPLTVNLEIENLGGVVVNSVTVKANGINVGNYPVSLKIGETKMVSFPLPIPSGMTPLTKFKITVEPTGLTDVNMEDNSLDITPGYVNFSMFLDTKYNDDNTITVTTKISNNSDYAAKVKLITRLGSALIAVDYNDLGNFAARAYKEYKYTYKLDELIPQPKGDVPLLFEIISDKESEYKTYDYISIHNISFIAHEDSVPGLSVKDHPKPSVFSDNSVLVYPNPTTGDVKVVIVDQGNSNVNIETVDVYDMFGRKIMSHSANLSPQTAFNVAHLASGIYFLRVKTDNNMVTKKLIKH